MQYIQRASVGRSYVDRIGYASSVVPVEPFTAPHPTPSSVYPDFYSRASDRMCKYALRGDSPYIQTFPHHTARRHFLSLILRPGCESGIFNNRFFHVSADPCSVPFALNQLLLLRRMTAGAPPYTVVIRRRYTEINAW
jgi:hypothetical protein